MSDETLRNTSHGTPLLYGFYDGGSTITGDGIRGLRTDIEGNLIVNVGPSTTLSLEIEQGIPRTKSAGVTDVASTVTLAAESKTFTISNIGSKTVNFRFDVTDDYVQLEPGEIWGDVLRTTTVRVICPTAADTSTVDIKYTIE